MPAWPGTLPALWTANGYREQDADNVIRSAPDVGPPKRRRRSTAAMRRIDCVVDLTDTQRATLKAFYAQDCAHGALSFTRIDAHGTSRTFYFEAPPAYSYAGYDWWQAELVLGEKY